MYYNKALWSYGTGLIYVTMRLCADCVVRTRDFSIPDKYIGRVYKVPAEDKQTSHNT